jgi:hypothetical protein
MTEEFEIDDDLRVIDVPRCGTCQHWLPSEPMQDPETDEPVKAPGRWGTCEWAGQLGPREGSDRFYVADASEYMAWLGTREDFGCVEHEPKTA